MAMFAEKEEQSFLQQFQLDYKRLYSLSGEEQLTATLSLARRFFKTIIGRSHEYSIEEALFILKEEEIISTEHYEQFKEMLLTLSYYRFSPAKSEISNDFLQNFEKLLLEITRESLKKEQESEFLKHYKAATTAIEQDIEGHDSSFLKHKKDIVAAERKIVEKIHLEQIQRAQVQKIAEAEQESHASHDEEEKERVKREAAKKAEELRKELDAVNAQIDIHQSKKELSQQSPFAEGEDFSIKVPFQDFFFETVGYTPEKISELANHKHIARDIIWDLYAKYHLLADSDPHDKLYAYIQETRDKFAIEKALRNNDHYATSSKYAYLREMRATLLIIVIFLLNKKDLRDELPKLYDRFSKDMIYYVLQNLFPTQNEDELAKKPEQVK